MILRSSVRRFLRTVGRRWMRNPVLALAMLSVLPCAAAAQQTNKTSPTASAKPKAAQTPRPPSPFLQAETLLSQGLLDEAKKETLAQLQLHPSSSEGYKLLGIICVSQKDYVNAMEAFQHALKLEPASAGLHNDLGNVFMAQGKPDLAEKEFRKALLLDSSNRDANFNLGLLLMAKNQPVEAIPHFQRVHPVDTPTRFNLLRAYLRAGKTAEGLKLANEISGQDPNNVNLHTTLGALLASEKQWRSAQLELEKANCPAAGNIRDSL